jgi:hypothetical protein
MRPRCLIYTSQQLFRCKWLDGCVDILEKAEPTPEFFRFKTVDSMVHIFSDKYCENSP